MKRLRHPIRAITEPFGKAGLIVAMIALVAALGGTALAAAKLNGTQRKEVAKIAKKEASKVAKAGATGPAGPQGAKGDAGAAGANGTVGAGGTPGAPGESVTIASATSAECPEGGAKLGNGTGQKAVCNGEEGPQGPAGPTCPGGQCVLPTGATETGIWSFRTINVEKGTVSISYPLRVPGGLTYHYVKWAEQGRTPPAVPGCPSAEAAEPEALPGNLCVYEGGASSEAELTNAEVPVILAGEVDLSSGVALNFQLKNPASEAKGAGTWAATR